jgi:hypothetical protein
MTGDPTHPVTNQCPMKKIKKFASHVSSSISTTFLREEIQISKRKKQLSRENKIK